MRTLVACRLAGTAFLSLAGMPALAAAAPSTELEQVTAAWLAAINAGDNERGRLAFADDAAVIGPAGPIAVGRAEVDASTRALTSTPGFHVSFTPERSSIAADGQTGFVVGASAIDVPTAKGGRTTVHQRLLVVWRKDAAGQWKCILDVAMGAPAR